MVVSLSFWLNPLLLLHSHLFLKNLIRKIAKFSHPKLFSITKTNLKVAHVYFMNCWVFYNYRSFGNFKPFWVRFCCFNRELSQNMFAFFAFFDHIRLNFYCSKKAFSDHLPTPKYKRNLCKLSYLKSDFKFSKINCIYFQHLLNIHCKCLQGFTGGLRGNPSAGISNLQGLRVVCIHYK